MGVEPPQTKCLGQPPEMPTVQCLYFLGTYNSLHACTSRLMHSSMREPLRTVVCINTPCTGHCPVGLLKQLQSNHSISIIYTVMHLMHPITHFLPLEKKCNETQKLQFSS